MAFIVLMPGSATNSDPEKYKVVDQGEWMRFTNGATSTLPTYGETDDYEEAKGIRDGLNEAV